MIIIAGEMEFAAKDAAKARAGAIAMQNETVKEKGCVRYRFWADLEVEGRLHVYEEWESDADLAAHIQSPHMKTWRELVGSLDLRSRNVRKFEAGDPQPLG